MFTGHLGPDDLHDILEAIFSVKHKWYSIGLKLWISHHTLDAIKTQCSSNIKDCLTETLKQWLSNTSPLPTWSGLIQALSSEPVGEKRLAEDIREQYCHQDGEQATALESGE